MSANDLFSFQGRVLLAERRPNGKPGVMRFVGNAPALQLQLTVDNSDLTESFSGSRGLYGRLKRATAVAVNLTLSEWTMANLALGMFGKPFNVAGGTVTKELLPAGLVNGDLVQLDNRFVSNVVISDGAATPVALPVAAYELDSESAGLVKLVDVGTKQQPFSAAYSYAAAESLALFTSTAPERWLVLDGVNTVNNQRVVVDLYRVQFDPLGSLDLINEEHGTLELTGAGMIDVDKVPDDTLGGFGRITQQKATT